MRFFTFILVFFSVLSITQSVYASVLSLVGDQSTLKVGDVFSIEVLMDTQGEMVNAIGATVVFPDFLHFVKSEEKDSHIPLWVQHPALKSEHISFEGIIPGGLDGQTRIVTRLYFEVEQEGQGLVSFREAQVLLHDGLGTESEVVTEGFHVTTVSGTATRPLRPSLDDEPPSPFTPTILKDADVNGGQTSLIFQTRDTFSGVSHYEVKEGLFGLFKRVESPYELQKEDGTMIVVRAYDYAGNMREAILYPHRYAAYVPEYVVFFSILLVCILFLLALFFFLRKRYYVRSL